MSRCHACGTDGSENSMGRFVSDDWVRAAKLKEDNDQLRAENAALLKRIDALQERVALTNVDAAQQPAKWRTR